MDRHTSGRLPCGCADKRAAQEQSVQGTLGNCNLALAISTVPMQQADWGNIYGLSEALCAGTIFPDLYLPFKGSNR